jgi:hypothetical protein
MKLHAILRAFTAALSCAALALALPSAAHVIAYGVAWVAVILAAYAGVRWLRDHPP